MLNQVRDWERLAVDFGTFGFVVRIVQMMIHLGHCQRRWQQQQLVQMVENLQIAVDQQIVVVAAVPIELVESSIENDKEKFIHKFIIETIKFSQLQKKLD